MTTDEIFKRISIGFNGHIELKRFSELFQCICPGYYVDTQEATLLLRKYIVLELIASTVDKKGVELYYLSDKGVSIMNQLNFGKGTK